MIRRLIVVGAAALALGLGTGAMAQDAAKIEKGKKVYAEAKPKAWLRTPKEMAAKAKAERKPPMPAYPAEKLSDEDLDALTAYLLSLKK